MRLKTIEPQRRGRQKLAYNELGEALISCLEHDTPEEIKEQMLACCDEFLKENPRAKRIIKIKLMISRFEDKNELIKYAYNFLLSSEGLRVHRVV